MRRSLGSAGRVSLLDVTRPDAVVRKAAYGRRGGWGSTRGRAEARGIAGEPDEG
ncbi:hypothetical protein ACFVXA_25550 [Streptomyces sp. NPDC058246]|uniref:hypothetical protein n=1 Tax=Streptomyces sp. NPDC058246 TaxID=3346400 RepID=UPI0036E0E4E3